MKKWIDIAGKEEMKTELCSNLIQQHVYNIQEKIGNPKSVLVVGCGDGAELRMWSNAIGIDLNEKSVAICNKRGFLVKKMDMHEMSFSDGEFELVTTRDVFEHSPSPIQLISEMARVSSKYVEVTIPDESWQSSHWHYIIPTIKQMISLGEKVGLMLKMFREYNLIQGNQVVFQSQYLFQKEL